MWNSVDFLRFHIDFFFSRFFDDDDDRIQTSTRLMSGVGLKLRCEKFLILRKEEEEEVEEDDAVLNVKRALNLSSIKCVFVET